MADEIIDLTRYLKREADTELPRGAMALWGAEGERSRFALPLWRLIYLAQAERCVIVARDVEQDRVLPFVALDVARDPARTGLDRELPSFEEVADATMIDDGEEGLLVYLGERGGREWSLVIDGVRDGREPLSTRAREDILFLAGECAGLLFLRDLADSIGIEEE